jgi:hypothetical protein
LGGSRVEAPRFEAVVQAGHIHRLDVLSSSIDDRDIEVTVANIAMAMKCNAEHPEADD